MRKTLAMLLILSMLLSMIPAVFAAETGMTAAEAEAAVEKLNAGSDFYYELVEKYDDSQIEHRTEVRWWMAEGAHTDETLIEEVQAMYDAGFRGVELCQLDVGGLNETVWGLGTDQWNHDFQVVLNKALDLGMSVGITSGTNWNTTNVPGLDPNSQAAMQVAIDVQEVVASGQTRSGDIPVNGIRGDADFIGAYAYPSPTGPIRSDSRYLQITDMPSNPTTFTIDTDVILENESTGFCFGMTGTNNFIMWQINNGDNAPGKIQCRPHYHINGSWVGGGDYDITNLLGYTTETFPGKPVHMKIEVLDGRTVKTYFNNSDTPAFITTIPGNWGTCSLNKLGFRQDIDFASKTEELGRYDNIVVKDADGKVIYENSFDDPANPGFEGPGVRVVDGWLRVGLDQVEGNNILKDDSVFDLTDKVVLHADGRTGTLEWTAPNNGDYTIFYLWSQANAQESNPSVKPAYCVNYFDRRGFEAWSEFFSETVLNDPELNAKIMAGDVQIFMDSLEFHWNSGFTFWCENFAEEFQARKGYDIRPYLILAKGLSGGPVTWYENADFVRGTYDLADSVRGQQIRNDLHDVQTELYMENLLQPMEEWLNQYNIDLRAQISYGRTPEISEPIMAVDFPEAENLNQRNQVDIYRLWSGGSHLQNKVLSSETGATFGMQYAYDHQTHLQEAYSLYSAGFSRINWHIWTSSWSPVTVGQSWPGFQSLNVCNVLGLREPGYNEYYELNQHLGRVQQLLREGKSRTDVGMLYLKYNQEIPFSVANAAEDMWMQRHDYMFFPSTELQENGYTYDYFSHEFLNADGVSYNAEEGTLELAGYKALVLWQCWLALEGAQEILDLAKQGMKVVIVDGAAELTPYDEDAEAFAAVMAELKSLDNVKVAATADDVLETLQALGVEPYAAFESVQLLTQVRQDGDDRYLYVYNYCDGSLHDGDDANHGLNCTTDVAMDGTYIPYEIDAWSGEVTQLANYRWENGKTIITVDLNYGDVALYAFEAVEKETVHLVSAVRKDVDPGTSVKVEAENCKLLSTTNPDYPHIYADGAASGGSAVDHIAYPGDGVEISAVEAAADSLTLVFCGCENGNFGIYVNDELVREYPFTGNGAWTGSYKTATIPLDTPLQVGDKLAVKRINAGFNLDCILLETEPTQELDSTYVSGGKLMARAIDSGIYTATLSDGTQQELTVTVPNTFDITGWDLTVEEWTQGAEIFREDTQFGLLNREHTYATNKNSIHVSLDKMTTWNNISGIGRGVSGRGFYKAKFNWDGTADGAYLDFGELLNSMKVYINGVQTADVNMNAPVLDIGDYLVVGKNTIELEYSSTLTNEMLELGRISAGGNSSGSPAWGGYYKDYRAYGPSQAVVIPYVNAEIEQSVTDVTLSLTGTEHAHVTETVSYTLSAAGMVRLATMLVEVDLDEALLTDPVAAPVGDWYIITQRWKDGKLLVVVGNNEGAVGEGDILTITAAPTGQAGEATASIAYAEMGAYDGEGEVLVTALYEDATCTTVLTSYDIFDVNKDGVVNLLDVTRAQRFYGLYDADSDVDKDGKITVNDLILIINNYSDLFD